jgi:hypothetical protein
VHIDQSLDVTYQQSAGQRGVPVASACIHIVSGILAVSAPDYCGGCSDD